MRFLRSGTAAAFGIGLLAIAPAFAQSSSAQQQTGHVRAGTLRCDVAAGTSFVRDRVSGVLTEGGRVREVRLASGDTIETDRFVIAAGPALPDVARLLDIELPVVHELHAKMTFHDTRRTVGRDAPFVIWMDPVKIQWTDEEFRESFWENPREALEELISRGTHLTRAEMAALLATDRTLWKRVAIEIDPKAAKSQPQASIERP